MTRTPTRTRSLLLPVAAVVAAALLLMGCSSGGASARPTESATTSATGGPVTDDQLGRTLERIVYAGSKPPGNDGGKCFVTALRATDISDSGLSYLVGSAVDGWGAAIQGLRDNVGDADANVFGSQSLRTEFDRCADIALGHGATTTPSAAAPTASATSIPTVSATTRSVPSNTASAPVAKAANLTPKYPIASDETITSASQLEPGLVSMFSSFTQDAKQKQVYKQAGACLAEVVFGAGLSQESLRFLAGGAELGTGAVVDHLATDDDRATWNSPDFKTELVVCTDAGH